MTTQFKKIPHANDNLTIFAAHAMLATLTRGLGGEEAVRVTADFCASHANRDFAIMMRSQVCNLQLIS